jgi:methionyl-tRNA formyltransferase
VKTADAGKVLSEYQPDLIVVAAYGQILPLSILELPKYGCVNIHASLLPKYRGAAPINRAIINGDTVGGVTIMYMEQGLDTGDMLLKREIDIPESMNAGEYHDALANAGGEAIVEFIQKLAEGNVEREKQDDTKATYAAKIDKSELEIDFSQDNVTVRNFIRGMAPYPAAFFWLDGMRVKALAATLHDGSGTPGSMRGTADGIEIFCQKGSIIVTLVKPEGKREMTGNEFVRGHRF